jgi:1-aminocyclopropane-1-carboxylate deaminase
MEILSPIHTVKLPSGISIAVKRDDLIDPYISGNKWRKLKYILKDVSAKKKSHLVTFGGAYSNHLVATAAAAAKANFKATAFVRGENVDNELLFICKLFGMRLIFTDRTSYRDKNHLFEKYFGNDQAAYFIDEGGAGTAAVKGCAEIIDELPVEYDHICCAAGTGTTAAGLLKGINTHQLKTKLEVVPVLKGGEFIESEIRKFENNLSPLNLQLNYHFGGYAKTTPGLLKFINNFSASTGLLIDPIYTGKLFFAIDDLSKQHYFKKDAKILALHTGGLLGILGKRSEFSNLQ